MYYRIIEVPDSEAKETDLTSSELVAVRLAVYSAKIVADSLEQDTYYATVYEKLRGFEK